MNNNLLFRKRLIQGTLREGVSPSALIALVQAARESGIDPYKGGFALAQQAQIPRAIAERAIAAWQDDRSYEELLALCEKNQIQIVTLFDEEYPAYLAAIENPPPLLYVQGAVALLGRQSIAFVGSRQASAYGYHAVDALVPQLAIQGLVLVSGGAVGIDTHAHRVALSVGMPTIAVLGSGLLRPYPAMNKQLFTDIVAAGGAIVSIFGLTMPPIAHNFPARNRVIAGFTTGCVVIQAAAKSGALITATMAMQQGRTVMAVPGRFDDRLSDGCHALISQGATLVTSADDVLQALELQPKRSAQGSSNRPAPTMAPILAVAEQEEYEELPDEVVATLARARRPLGLEEICAITNLSWLVAQERLFLLQLEGAVAQDFAGMWQLNRS